jgi:hypothetical protein
MPESQGLPVSRLGEANASVQSSRVSLELDDSVLHELFQEQEVNVGLDALERMQQTTQVDLIKEFAQKEKNNRYLIVLEDLCTMVQWDAIRSYLPDRKKGSRIVVLTHHPVVASQCTGEPCRVSEVDQFSPGDSVRVYYKEVLIIYYVFYVLLRKERHSLLCVVLTFHNLRSLQIIHQLANEIYSG